MRLYSYVFVKIKIGEKKENEMRHEPFSFLVKYQAD